MSIKKENNSLSANVIYDITKFTHLDYPDHLSCIVWFGGCNMRCDYCYNKDIVFAKNFKFSYLDAIEFLKTRVSLLDAVVLSGGEATLYNLVEFCKIIKELGFKIKLDTNGTNPSQVKELLDLKLLDFVALDYKATPSKFKSITHSDKHDKFSKTLNLLINEFEHFEVRTTLHSDLLNVDDINEIIKDLVSRGYDKNYYIQKFQNTGTNIASLNTPISFFDESLLLNDLNIVWR